MGLEHPVPDFLAPLFWDVNLSSLGPDHEAFVIERILNYGDIPAIQWMWRTFRDDSIISVVRHSRRLTRKAASFWALIYDIPPDEVRSLMLEADWTGVPSGSS